MFHHRNTEAPWHSTVVQALQMAQSMDDAVALMDDLIGHIVAHVAPVKSEPIGFLHFRGGNRA